MNVNLAKSLRNKTGASLSLIKEAMLQAQDNEELALEYIKKHWTPPNREASFSKIFSYVHQGRIGVLLQMGCGTDFVAKTPDFENLAKEILLQIVSGLPGELTEQEWIRDSSKKIGDLLNDVSKKTGEKISVWRAERWEV